VLFGARGSAFPTFADTFTNSRSGPLLGRPDRGVPPVYMRRNGFRARRGRPELLAAGTEPATAIAGVCRFLTLTSSSGRHPPNSYHPTDEPLPSGSVSSAFEVLLTLSDAVCFRSFRILPRVHLHSTVTKVADAAEAAGDPAVFGRGTPRFQARPTGVDRAIPCHVRLWVEAAACSLVVAPGVAPRTFNPTTRTRLPAVRAHPPRHRFLFRPGGSLSNSFFGFGGQNVSLFFCWRARLINRLTRDAGPAVVLVSPAKRCWA